MAPSRLLMPLAYGTLLGGTMTQIGTPPNLLIHMSLREAGLPGMGFFQFAWLGLPMLLVGTAFMALAGRHLLPSRALGADEAVPRDLRSVWQLDERILALRTLEGSAMAGRSIANSGLGSAASLLVIAPGAPPRFHMPTWACRRTMSCWFRGAPTVSSGSTTGPARQRGPQRGESQQDRRRAKATRPRPAAPVHAKGHRSERCLPDMAQRRRRPDEHRPRKTLGWRTPAEAMVDEIAAFRSIVALEVGI